MGTYAVQFARWAGAHAVATASARDSDFLRNLGAERVIDYVTTQFEDVIHDVDVVFDMVGDETLARSWRVVKPGGVIVSVVSPPPSTRDATNGARFVWFVVEPSGEQLRQIGALLDARQIRPIVDQVFPLAEARQAFLAAQNRPRGKIVLRVGDDA